MSDVPRPVAHSLVQALRVVPEFGSLDDGTLVRVVGASANLFWAVGSGIFEQGSPSDGLYIVLSGEVGIFEPGDEGEVEVGRIGPGDFFGELSMLLHTTHTKSARAIGDSELMVLPKESFQELLADHPELGLHMRHKVEERWRGSLPAEAP